MEMNDDENPAEPSIGEKTISTATIGDKLLVSISDRRENPGEATFSLFIVERIDDPPLRLQLMRFEPIYTLIATSDPKYRFLMILTARRTIATSEISTGLFISFQQDLRRMLLSELESPKNRRSTKPTTHFPRRF